MSRPISPAPEKGDASDRENPDESEGSTGDNDSIFDGGASQESSFASFPPPPRPEEITRMQKHTSMQEFGNDLQKAAKCIFPNENQSRYRNVYVLMFMWEIGDSQLPVH